MNNTINNLLERIERVKPTGEGVWQARCPAHADKTPSLRVRLIEDGRILIHCFAGCGAVAVMEAIGLTLADLMPARLPGHRYKANHKPYMPQDVVDILKHEANRLLILGADVEAGKTNTSSLTECVDRIETIARMTYGRG